MLINYQEVPRFEKGWKTLLQTLDDDASEGDRDFAALHFSDGIIDDQIAPFSAANESSWIFDVIVIFL